MAEKTFDREAVIAELNRLAETATEKNASDLMAEVKKLGFFDNEYDSMVGQWDGGANAYAIYENGHGMFVEMEYTMKRTAPGKDSFVAHETRKFLVYPTLHDFVECHAWYPRGYAPKVVEETPALGTDETAQVQFKAELKALLKKYNARIVLGADKCSKWDGITGEYMYAYFGDDENHEIRLSDSNCVDGGTID